MSRKTIVLILWHANAHRFRAHESEISQFADMVLYSAKLLENDPDALNDAMEDLLRADFAVFGSNSGDNIWPKVIDFAEKNHVPHAYVGTPNHPMSMQELEWSVQINEYYMQSGSRNYVNMMRMAAKLAGDEQQTPEPVAIVPWQTFDIMRC